MTVGRGKDFEEKETKEILKVLKNTSFDPDDKWGKYKHYTWKNKEEVKISFGEHLLSYITQMTYPYGEPISLCWSKLYGATSKDRDITPPSGSQRDYYWGVVGRPSMGLHQEKWVYGDMEIGKDPLKFWSTTLLVTKSDDLEGGEIVLAGDSIDDLAEFQSRLKVINLKEKGQTASWNGETVHGVAEITKGTRWVLVTFKDVN